MVIWNLDVHNNSGPKQTLMQDNQHLYSKLVLYTTSKVINILLISQQMPFSIPLVQRLISFYISPCANIVLYLIGIAAACMRIFKCSDFP